jgi:putative membrane protein
MRILFAIIGNALALLATTIVPGILFKGDVLTLLAAGAILGLFNLIVRPLAMLLSLPLLILTLGLFYFILNAILLWVASAIIPGYSIAGFVPALIGSLVMTVVNWLVHAITGK